MTEQTTVEKSWAERSTVEHLMVLHRTTYSEHPIEGCFTCNLIADVAQVEIKRNDAVKAVELLLKGREWSMGFAVIAEQARTLAGLSTATPGCERVSAIDRVKELLAGAEKPCGECAQAVRRIGDIERCGHQVYAEMKLKSHAISIAEELVASQEALRTLVPWLDGIKAKDAARAALRMDGLKKAMDDE